MTARRDYGTGSVYQRESDWRWIAAYEAGYNSNGDRRRGTVSITGCAGGCKERCPHRAEIKRKLAKKLLDVDQHGHSTANARTTVKTFSETWLEMTKDHLRPKPWATDRSAVRKWIVPTVGHVRLDEITPKHLRDVDKAQKAAGLSSSTQRRTRLTFTSMLRAAMIDGHRVPPNVLLLKAPSVAVSDRDEMPVAEVLLVLNAAIALLPHWSRWFLQVLYGPRPAEALGFTWDEVDLDAGAATVSWQLQSLPYVDRKDKAQGFRIPEGFEVRQLDRALHLTRPKTKKGFRSLPLIPSMHRALVDWQEISQPSPHGLIWPAADGTPADQKDDLAEWYALQDTVGVRHPSGRRYYMYEARHGFATRLLETGADDHVITALMGHSSIVTSRGYQHVKQALALEAMQRVAEQFGLNELDES